MALPCFSNKMGNKNKHIVWHSLLVFIFLGFFGESAFSTLVFIEDLPSMTKKSQVIIHAGVVHQESQIDEDGRIITLTTLEVIEAIKGASTGEYLTVYQVGGEYEGRVLNVSGAHRYQLGEELFLFGLRMEDKLVSYGLGLGKFKVLGGKDGEKVVEDLHDLVSAKSGPKGKILIEDPIPRTFPSVEIFKSSIRNIIVPKIRDFRFPEKPMKQSFLKLEGLVGVRGNER